jgi:hypothetical protein
VLGALVDLPQQQGSGCAALKIAMVAVTAAYAVAFAVLRPSNTRMDAAVTALNAVIGAAVAVVVLLQGPGAGVQLAFTQGMTAVVTAMLPAMAVGLSRRAPWRDKEPVLSQCSSDSCGSDVPGPLMGVADIDCNGGLMLGDALLDDAGYVEEFPMVLEGVDSAEDTLEDTAEGTEGSEADSTEDTLDHAVESVRLQETCQADNSIIVSAFRPSGAGRLP